VLYGHGGAAQHHCVHSFVVIPGRVRKKKDMKTKGWLYFCYGCISGLFVASITVVITQYVGNLTQIGGLHPSQDVGRLHIRASAEYSKPNLIAVSDSEYLETKRYMYLVVVISSVKEFATLYKAVSISWGSMTTHWKVSVSGISYNNSLYKYDIQFSDHLLLADKCEDFLSYSNVSSADLFCLLQSIYLANSSDYKWFVIAPSNSYLAVDRLSSMLAPQDPNIPHYFGKSSMTCNEREGRLCHSYCSLEHPIILSQAALKEVASQLSPCFYSAKAMASSGDRALGWCLNKALLLTCSDSVLGSQVMFHKKNVPLNLQFW